MKLLVMIPTFNEAENIGGLIRAVLAQDERAEVLVVDDDSPDGTAALVRDSAENNPRVHLLVRKQERGRGKAAVAGFLKALELGADWVLEMDGDFSHHPRYIPAFLKAIETCDVVIGSRLIPGGGERGRSFFRQFITSLANHYIRLVFSTSVRDCTSGFRCFRRAVLKSLPLTKMVSQGPALVEEMLYCCLQKKFSIKEIPIVFDDRSQGKSKLTFWKLLTTLVLILRFRFLPLPK